MFDERLIHPIRVQRVFGFPPEKVIEEFPEEINRVLDQMEVKDEVIALAGLFQLATDRFERIREEYGVVDDGLEELLDQGRQIFAQPEASHSDIS